jgi:Methyltransferase domain
MMACRGLEGGDAMAWRGTRPQKIMRLARTFATDPVVVSRALPGEIRQWYQWHTRGETPRFAVDEAWNEHLHKLLGAQWPCPEYQRFDEIMTDIGTVLGARGWGFGRDTYAWYADGDRSLCRAAWCVVLHARPEVVIETGVAHGVTTRVVLEALRQNDFGHLWSIDLPFPFDHRLHGETAIAVPDACRSRWSYVEGSSKQRLPALAAELGHVELFIHDSLHTAENTLFEMEEAASVMRPGGVLLVDDIDSHTGFATFAESHPSYQSIICPDADRDTREGMFGIAVTTAND